MSHFSNDLIADKAIDDACAKVDSMANSAIKRQLIMHGKIVSVMSDDDMKDALIDILADINFKKALDVPSLHG
jgi:predicted transcriptional regulator